MGNIHLRSFFQLQWNPINAILLTLDFFVGTLNVRTLSKIQTNHIKNVLMQVYALLCVISQYQELREGRGRAEDEQNQRV